MWGVWRGVRSLGGLCTVLGSWPREAVFVCQMQTWDGESSGGPGRVRSCRALWNVSSLRPCLGMLSTAEHQMLIRIIKGFVTQTVMMMLVLLELSWEGPHMMLPFTETVEHLFPALSPPEGRVMGTDRLRMPQHAANASSREEMSLGNIPGMMQWMHNSHTTSLLLPAPLHHLQLLLTLSDPTQAPHSSWLGLFGQSQPPSNHNPLDWGRCTAWSWDSCTPCLGLQDMGVKTLPWLKNMNVGASCET